MAVNPAKVAAEEQDVLTGTAEDQGIPGLLQYEVVASSWVSAVFVIQTGSGHVLGCEFNDGYRCIYPGTSPDGEVWFNRMLSSGSLGQFVNRHLMASKGQPNQPF